MKLIIQFTLITVQVMIKCRNLQNIFANDDHMVALLILNVVCLLGYLIGIIFLWNLFQKDQDSYQDISEILSFNYSFLMKPCNFQFNLKILPVYPKYT